jgi:ribosomal protein S18 acetylase RimI-like enzyme
MEASDLEDVLSMMRALFEGDGMPFDDRAARHGFATLRTTAAGQHPPARVWVIESAGASAGYIALTSAFSFEFGGWHAFVDELFIREPFRNRGWGTRALEFAVQTCRELGWAALLLEVDLTNEHALRLYRRIGFREHRRRLMRLPVAESG